MLIFWWTEAPILFSLCPEVKLLSQIGLVLADAARQFFKVVVPVYTPTRVLVPHPCQHLALSVLPSPLLLSPPLLSVPL